MLLNESVKKDKYNKINYYYFAVQLFQLFLNQLV